MSTLGVDDSLVVVFEYQATQNTGGVCAGIDSNSVGMDIGFRANAMAVYDDGTVIQGASQEFIAYPDMCQGNTITVECFPATKA